jgi:hypothetical protein
VIPTIENARTEGETLFPRVYYESIKREPKIRGIYECRCDERLQTKTKEFTRLGLLFVSCTLIFLATCLFLGTCRPEK